MSILRERSAKSHETSGLIAGIAAFTTWGLIPIYWKLLAAVPATEILAHRFVWTTIFLSIVLSWQRRWPELVANVRSPRARLFCLTRGLAIAWNSTRSRRHSGLVHRNDPARSVCGGFSHFPSAIRRACIRPRGLAVVDLAHQHRHRYGRPALLVRLCHPISPPDHGRFPPISFSDRFVLSWRFPLSRTVYAQPSHHFHLDLARAGAFHRRSSPALAIPPCS